MFGGARVLITGGSGSFGTAFTKYLLTQGVERVVCLSRSEHKQAEMERQFNDDRLRLIIGDVRDRDRLDMAFRGVDIVIHAAALKRVEKGETDPDEFVKTNVGGAMNVIRAAIDNRVNRVVALSTDKAASPITAYGACKLCAEKLFLTAHTYVPRDYPTQFAVTRYGNVMGSAGSVIPLFRELVGQNKPLKLTDRQATRFWMHMDEAVDLVANTVKRMRGGELFVPKLPSFKVEDLAFAIAGYQYVPGITTIGMRGVEKTHESLLSVDEGRNASDCGDVYALGLRGTPMPPGWSYSSDNNPHFLTRDDITERLKVT